MGISSAIGAGADFLFGAGAADAIGFGAADAGVGAATIGAGAGGAAAGAGGLADLVGTGAGLAGGATGLEGTLLAGGVSAADIASGAALGTAGLGAAGTAADFLAAPAASGFNAAAITPSAVGDASIFGPASGTLPSSVANANAAIPGGNSVFNTGTSGITGVNGAGGASAVPGGGGAASLAAPAGVTAPVDATTTAAGQVAGAAGPTSVGGAPVAGGSSSIDSLLGKAGTGVLDSLTKNPLGVALGAGGLGYNILQGQKQSANQKALAADASTATANSNQMVASGEALQQYLANGTLPPAYQTQVDQAISSAKTAAISNAAAQGQSTDPTQNTALAATLAGIDNQRGAMQSQVASTLFSSGSSLVGAGQSAAGLSGQLYEALVQNDTTQAANTGKAIATLAAALNGKSSNSVGGINISTG